MPKPLSDTNEGIVKSIINTLDTFTSPTATLTPRATPIRTSPTKTPAKEVKTVDDHDHHYNKIDEKDSLNSEAEDEVTNFDSKEYVSTSSKSTFESE